MMGGKEVELEREVSRVELKVEEIPPISRSKTLMWNRNGYMQETFPIRLSLVWNNITLQIKALKLFLVNV